MHSGTTHIYDFRWYKWEKIDDAFVKCVKIMLKSYQNHISVHLFIVSLLVANALSVIIINVVRALSLACFAAKVISVRKYLCYDRSTKYLAIAVIADTLSVKDNTRKEFSFSSLRKPIPKSLAIWDAVVADPPLPIK